MEVFPTKTQSSASTSPNTSCLTISQALFADGERLDSLHGSLVDFDGFVRVSGQQVNLPQHHESPVVFVHLKGSVEMFFSLAEEEISEERNERTSWKRCEYSRFSGLWWRNNTNPDYGWSPGGEKKPISGVCDLTQLLSVRDGPPDRQVVLHWWGRALVSAISKLNALLPRTSKLTKQFASLTWKQSKTSGVFFFTQSLSATLAASW